MSKLLVHLELDEASFIHTAMQNSRKDCQKACERTTTDPILIHIYQHGLDIYSRAEAALDAAIKAHIERAKGQEP